MNLYSSKMTSTAVAVSTLTSKPTQKIGRSSCGREYSILQTQPPTQFPSFSLPAPASNTYDFADIDRGKIICVAMPQKFQLERRYVNTASEDGMSDYNCIDVIREAQAAVVAAAQSSTSFVPPLGREKARLHSQSPQPHDLQSRR